MLVDFRAVVEMHTNRQVEDAAAQNGTAPEPSQCSCQVDGGARPGSSAGADAADRWRMIAGRGKRDLGVVWRYVGPVPCFRPCRSIYCVAETPSSRTIHGGIHRFEDGESLRIEPRANPSSLQRAHAGSRTFFLWLFLFLTSYRIHDHVPQHRSPMCFMYGAVCAICLSMFATHVCNCRANH